MKSSNMSKNIIFKKEQQPINIVYEQYKNFLNEHKVEKGSPCTHTGFGEPYGGFNIEGEEEIKFMKLYNKLVNKKDLHIVERPLEIGPLLIDIDFRFGRDKNERQYTDDDIKRIVGIANRLLSVYYSVSSKTLKSFILEKPKPTFDNKNNKNEYKDGFHIVYPFIALSVEMRYLIIHKLKETVKVKKVLDHLNFINSLDDIFDISVVKSNGWMMYGSKKQNGQLYELKKIYDFKLKEIDKSEFSDEELTKILSNRKFKNKSETNIKDKVNLVELDLEKEKVMQLYDPASKKKIRKRVKLIENNDNLSDSDEFEEDNKDKKEKIDKHKKCKLNEVDIAKKLAELLSEERATNYHTWIYVGWALHNTNTKLLNSFKKFSKKAINYDEQSCEKVWQEAREEGYTIASLHHWARHDNPEGYVQLIRNNINELLEDAESGTEYDIAKVIFELYKHQFKCASIMHNIWYEFQKHRWVEVERAYTLKLIISEELAREFAHLNSYYLTKYANEGGKEKDFWFGKAETVRKIIINLKKSAFKARLLEECSNLFYDHEFEGKLDSNRNIIGFNNGVYDLENECFRDGLPDDYLTYTVGYDYKEYSNDHADVKDIDNFFSKVMIDRDMKRYILTLLSTYLDGHTKQQKFIIWTGSGSNGKSATVEFMKMALGDYYGVLPNTVLTKKQGNSGAASPEMALMRGKRFVVFQEPENDDKINVGRMKELTGGDDIYARPLFRDPIRFKPQFKLLLTCNKLPFIPSTDGGTWRRLRVSPWESEFVDIDQNGLYDGKPLKANQFPKDLDLSEKMEKLKGALIWKLIRQYLDVYKKGNFKMKEPKKVTEKTDSYKKQSDLFLEFLDDNCNITGNKRDYELLVSLYSTFKTWYKESYANNKCPGKIELQEYLNNHDYEVRRGYVYGLTFKLDDNNLNDPLNK